MATVTPTRLGELRDQAAQVVFDQPNIHAKALEEALGIGDGSDRTAVGDALYRSMKNDKRFTKKQPGKATWNLKPHARTAVKKGRETVEV